MSANASAVLKVCCSCGKDVSHAQRMKDSHGKYWCVPCGDKDRKQHKYDVGGICNGCGESFTRAQLMDIAGQHLCPACRKRKFSHQQQGVGLIGGLKSLFGLKS